MASLGPIKDGDIVEGDVGGRRFFAHVVGKHGRELEVDPMRGQSATYTRLTGRQVRRHWRLTKNTS